LDATIFLVGTMCLMYTNRLVRDAKGRCRPALYPRIMLGRIWTIARAFFVSSACNWLIATCFLLAFESNEEGARNDLSADELTQHVGTTAILLFFGVLCTEVIRKAIQRVLAGAGSAAAEASSAASVSAVIGGNTDVRAALAEATRVFRTICFDQLTVNDLSSNAASSNLNSLARLARLGEIDFFLSHSWHDDHEAKWTALSRFATRFQCDYGRAPLLWFDKACLNQGDIAGSLSHLPVHMAGCQKLVVVAGVTYVTRLWALLELYVWSAMGKESSRIAVLPITEQNCTVEEVRHHRRRCTSRDSSPPTPAPA
jgi:hypothetical protein